MCLSALYFANLDHYSLDLKRLIFLKNLGYVFLDVLWDK